MKIVNIICKWIDLRSATTFLAVGASSALVYFLSFAWLWNSLHLNYKLAVSIAYLLSVIVHFTANRRITFRAHDHVLSKQLAKYSVMIAINYCITLFVMHGVVTHLGWSPYLGIVCSIAMTVGIGYLIAKFWVFRTPIIKADV